MTLQTQTSAGDRARVLTRAEREELAALRTRPRTAAGRYAAAGAATVITVLLL